MPRHRLLLAVAALLDVAAALTLDLPWWRGARGAFDMATGVVAPAPELTGEVVAGGGVNTTLWTLALLTAVGALLPLSLRARLAVATIAVAAGGVAAIAGLAVVTAWDPGHAGPWLAIAAGVLAVAAAVVAVPADGGSRRPVLSAVAFVGLLVAVVLPGAPSPHVRPASGPFEAVAALTPGDVAAGDAELPTSLGRLATVDGAPVTIGRTNAVGLGADGRALPVATSGDRWFSAVVDGRGIVGTDDGSGIVVTDLSGGASTTVTGADYNVGPVGPRGTLFVGASADAVYELDPVRLPTGTVDVATLPVAAAPRYAVPVDGGGVWRTPARDRQGGRIVLRTPAGERVLVGGSDAACGWTSDPARSYLAGTYNNRAATRVVTVDRTGGTWFTDVRSGVIHLLRLGPDGTLRIVGHPLPAPVDGLYATPEGDLLLALDEPEYALWRLPDAASATIALPAPGPGCGTQRRPAGPTLPTRPVDPATLPSGGDVVDGRGGTWSLVDRTEDVPVLVRTGRGGAERSPLPEQDGIPFLVGPDLGAGPLLAVDGGTALFADSRLLSIDPEEARSGAVGPDGRGWLLLDGRLVPVEAGKVGLPVVDAGPHVGDPTPVAVQLAQGAPAAALSLSAAVVGVDRAGRGVVVTADGVVLRVTGRDVEVLGEVADREVDPEIRQGTRYIDPDVGFVVDTARGLERLPLP